MTHSFLSCRAPSRGEEPHLTNLALPFPPRPVMLMQSHELPRGFERLFSRIRLEHGIAADDLLSLAERPVGHRQLPSGDPDAGARRARGEASGLDQGAVPEGVLGELGHGVQERLWRGPPVPPCLHDRKETHRFILSSSFLGWARARAPALLAPRAEG